MPRERSEVPKNDCWNVEALYPSIRDWEADYQQHARGGKSPRWPEIARFRGTLSKGALVLKDLLIAVFTIERGLTKLFTYSHLRHDEDVAEEEAKQAYVKATSLLYDFRQETSWIEPEILALPESVLKTCLRDPLLAEYQIYLEKIVRQKPHMLGAAEEGLLAQAGKALETAQRAFSALNNADLKFPPAEDSQGNLRELTHGTFLLYLRDTDRKLREDAFKKLHRTFLANENTLCELLQGQVQKHVFEMNARKFRSCLEAALFPHQIDTEVYHALIRSVRHHLPLLHEYMRLRKKLLGVDELHLYDLHVSVVKDVDFTMEYDEAQNLIVESLAPLGEEYQKNLNKGFQVEGWVDKYENARKRSGAYSSGCFDSVPYILMNYQGTFRDVMTLTHEAGHSMHTLNSCRNQPYQYSQYPIFVAEVASTFHEELLMRYLLQKEKQAEKRAYLINQKIEDLRGTLFRQAMFAEFELMIHQWGEEGVPLTPAFLKREYRKLNEEYFGKDVVIDQEIEIEWARIPHFYYNFYVYQYATGISAAHALVDRLMREGEPARKDYITFLSSGGSRYPLELLQSAGVDMRRVEAIDAALKHFGVLVGELAELCGEKKGAASAALK